MRNWRRDPDKGVGAFSRPTPPFSTELKACEVVKDAVTKWVYYVFHEEGVEIYFKKWNDWFKPRVINILAQISWSDASKSPRDKDRGEE